jgi:hypothetical protein
MVVAGAVLVVPRRLEAERRVGVQTLCFRHKLFFLRNSNSSKIS